MAEATLPTTVRQNMSLAGQPRTNAAAWLDTRCRANTQSLMEDAVPVALVGQIRASVRERESLLRQRCLVGV